MQPSERINADGIRLAVLPVNLLLQKVLMSDPVNAPWQFKELPDQLASLRHSVP